MKIKRLRDLGEDHAPSRRALAGEAHPRRSVWRRYEAGEREAAPPRRR